MKYRVVVWDFDGTLADSLGCLVRIYNSLADRRGFLPVEDVQAARNLPLRPFLRCHHIPLQKLPSLVRAVLTAQKSEMASMRLFPNLLPVLQQVRQGGTRMSILSSNAAANIVACLRANGVAELFESVIGYRRLFGKARGLRRLLREHDVVAAEAVYVGDEVRDIEAARQAGVASAAVTWGFHTRQLLASRSPDYLVDRPEDLFTCLG